MSTLLQRTISKNINKLDPGKQQTITGKCWVPSLLHKKMGRESVW